MLRFGSLPPAVLRLLYSTFVLFTHLTKIVQPQFEDCALVCRDLHVCMCYSNSTVEFQLVLKKLQ